VLYGLGGDVLPKGIEKPELKPVLSLRSEITHLKRVPAGESLGYGRSFVTGRDSLIATIPVGYADGLPRRLSGRGRVIINDRYAPIVGRISMDWTIVDVTDITDAEVGNSVQLIGSSANCAILAEDLAVSTETISYEITCGIGSRVGRQFIGCPND
jgi:alanine racemase